MKWAGRPCRIALLGLFLACGGLEAYAADACHWSDLQRETVIEQQLGHDGALRRYHVYLPRGDLCRAPGLPVVIGLHGYGGSGRGLAEDWGRLDKRVSIDGFIGVFPDGMSQSASAPQVRGFNDLGSRNDKGPDGLTCKPPPYAYPVFENCPASERERTCPWGNSCADDLGFLRALIGQLTADYPVDPERIYLFGYSQGGSTVNGLAAELSDLLAAVAPMHGFASNGFVRASESKLPFMQVWGREDGSVRADGKAGPDGLIYETVTETASEWARAQGCAASGATPWRSAADGTLGWRCQQHDDCRQGSEVVSCSWQGGHDWPRLGEDEFGWQVMWDFFQSHRRERL